MHPTYIKINAPVSNDPRDDKNQDEIIIRNSSVGSLIPAPGQQRLQNDWNGEVGDGWRVATQQAGTFYGLFRVESELRKFWRGKMMRLLPTQRKGEFLCIPESFFPSSTSSSLTSCRHAIFPFTLPTIHSRIIRHTLLVVFFIFLLLLVFLPGSLRLLCEIKSTFHMVSTEPPIVLA